MTASLGQKKLLGLDPLYFSLCNIDRPDVTPNKTTASYLTYLIVAVPSKVKDPTARYDNEGSCVL